MEEKHLELKIGPLHVEVVVESNEEKIKAEELFALGVSRNGKEMKLTSVSVVVGEMTP